MPSSTFYNEVLTDHNLYPAHKKPLPGANMTLEGVNPSCGDVIILQLKVENGKIEDGSFVGIGSFALNHLQKGLGQVFCFIHAAANDHVQHDICRSLGDRAAVTNKAAVLNLAVFYFQLQNNVIAAAGVHTLQRHVGAGQRLFMGGVEVVVAIMLPPLQTQKLPPNESLSSK